MSYSIEIKIPGRSSHRMSLNGNSGMIGSSKSCQFPIDHREVSAQALLLDVRGGNFWIQNLNPYSIYVGMDEVTPNAWSPWSAAETIQLTQSVSLTLIDENAGVAGAKLDSKEASDSASGFDMGKLLQLVVIGICFLGAGFLLFGPKSDVAGVIDKEFDFNEVVSKLHNSSNDVEYETVRRYLQQAWTADRRWRKSKPEYVMKYYELLVNHRLVRENPKREEIMNEISDYAKRRLSDLRFGQ
jgi:hypothetical protein